MNLYRRSTLQASLVLLAGIAGITTAVAQRHKPHQLRATAVLEFVHDPGGISTRLVPVTILDDGSLHDASIYKAAPEPMVLDTGVVYEAQKTGQAIGYFTVTKATKTSTAGIWTGQGRWELPRAPKAPTPAPSAGTRSADERPTLHRAGSAESAPATASPTPTPEVSSSPSDGRPVIRRPSTDGSAQSTPSPATTPSPTPAAAPEPEPDDPNRPTLRHRKPGSAQETENAPPPAKPAQPAATPVATPKSPASAPSGASATQTLVAVSDAQASDTRSYEFIWKPGEQEAMEKKMRRLALSQLPHENATGAFNGALTTLANVAIRGFDLDLSNEPVMVLTAEIPPGNAPAAAKPTTRTGSKATTGAKSSSSSAAAAGAGAAAPRVTRYLTLIARVDIDGNPQKLAASMTDSSRLDVAPRLELIDAVDVDGDGLAELLFREYSFDDKSFVIFSIGRTTVTKLFEGASEPLK
ncbi:MAG TPA: hypothetical protein VI488_00950 [Candidatus Angelobacter sp.]